MTARADRRFGTPAAASVRRNALLLSLAASMAWAVAYFCSFNDCWWTE